MKKEIELKYRLGSKDDFILLDRFLDGYAVGPKHLHQQENFYFDTPYLHLKRNNISLRLRKQNSEYLISAKQSFKGKKPGKHLSIRLEYEGRIDNAIASLILDDCLSPLDAFDLLPCLTSDELATKKTLYRNMRKAAKTGLQLIGSFVNLRRALPIDISGQTIVIELDHSIYPKAIEIFEVEIEFSSIEHVKQMRPTIENIFYLARIKTYQSSSKSSRLYRILFG
jgi:uncharacterized protein YjbK